MVARIHSIAGAPPLPRLAQKGPFDRLRARAYPYPSRLTLRCAARLSSEGSSGWNYEGEDQVAEK
jgi:hypothetical protein